MRRGLEGTSLLLRFAVRRDRVLLPAWVLTLSGMVAVSAAATGPLYPLLPIESRPPRR